MVNMSSQDAQSPEVAVRRDKSQNNPRPNKFFDPGNVGRKTGYRPRDDVMRDEDGFEDIEDFFKSPARDAEGSEYQSEREDDDNDVEMEEEFPDNGQDGDLIQTADGDAVRVLSRSPDPHRISRTVAATPSSRHVSTSPMHDSLAAAGEFAAGDPFKSSSKSVQRSPIRPRQSSGAGAHSTGRRRVAHRSATRGSGGAVTSPVLRSHSPSGWNVAPARPSPLRIASTTDGEDVDEEMERKPVASRPASRQSMAGGEREGKKERPASRTSWRESMTRRSDSRRASPDRAELPGDGHRETPIGGMVGYRADEAGDDDDDDAQHASDLAEVLEFFDGEERFSGSDRRPRRNQPTATPAPAGIVPPEGYVMLPRELAEPLLQQAAAKNARTLRPEAQAVTKARAETSDIGRRLTADSVGDSSNFEDADEDEGEGTAEGHRRVQDRPEVKAQLRDNAAARRLTTDSAGGLSIFGDADEGDGGDEEPARERHKIEGRGSKAPLADARFGNKDGRHGSRQPVASRRAGDRTFSFVASATAETTTVEKTSVMAIPPRPKKYPDPHKPVAPMETPSKADAEIVEESPQLIVSTAKGAGPREEVAAVDSRTDEEGANVPANVTESHNAEVQESSDEEPLSAKKRRAAHTLRGVSARRTVTDDEDAVNIGPDEGSASVSPDVAEPDHDPSVEESSEEELPKGKKGRAVPKAGRKGSKKAGSNPTAPKTAKAAGKVLKPAKGGVKRSTIVEGDVAENGRPKRARIKPVEYWNGERAEYARPESTGSDDAEGAGINEANANKRVGLVDEVEVNDGPALEYKKDEPTKRGKGRPRKLKGTKKAEEEVRPAPVTSVPRTPKDDEDALFRGLINEEGPGTRADVSEPRDDSQEASGDKLLSEKKKTAMPKTRKEASGKAIEEALAPHVPEEDGNVVSEAVKDDETADLHAYNDASAHQSSGDEAPREKRNRDASKARNYETKKADGDAPAPKTRKATGKDPKPSKAGVKRPMNAEDEVTENGRPKRLRVKPVEYWNGERVEYSRRMSLGKGLITEGVKNIIKVVKEEEGVSRYRARGGTTKRRIKVERDEECKEEAELFTGSAEVTVMDFITKKESLREIVCPFENMDPTVEDPKLAGSTSFYTFQRLFSEPDGDNAENEFSASGVMRMHKGGEKPNKSSGATAIVSKRFHV
ncbi:hypothetical protein HK101_005790 [Irineochytrium annulatum]|nr:hypothetical protein HK101_005790 [Irineochytrium annulatum]